MARMRWIGVVALALAACSGLGDDSPYEMPGSYLTGGGIEARWTGQPFPWKAFLPSVSRSLEAAPGGRWTMDYDLEVDLRRYEEKYGRFTSLVVGVIGEWRHDEQGWYRPGAVTFAVSSNFTTTGLPVERWDGWPRFASLHGKEGSPFEGIVELPLPGESEAIAHKQRFTGQLVVDLPADTPVGWYEPRVFVLARVEGVADPVHLGEYSYEWNDWMPAVLPLVRVGDPAPPKVPWTIFAEYPSGGRVGVLPRQWKGHAELVGRSGFRSGLLLPPGQYAVTPSMPALFPVDGMPYIDGGSDVVPRQQSHFLRLGDGEVNAWMVEPDGDVRQLGTRRFARPQGREESSRRLPLLPTLENSNTRPVQYASPDDGVARPTLAGGPYMLDMTETGRYSIDLTGTMAEEFGRTVSGGGTYDVTIAWPLSFSTSCKPGHSFLVGQSYSAKVNVNPPFPADVEVEIRWFPNSDPEREVRWVAKGVANRAGHFVPYDVVPLTFEEPGEYVSTVKVRYTDARGELWAGQQVSAGVVASFDHNDLKLHGTRSFPETAWSHEGAEEQFADRTNVPNSFLPQTNLIQQDPFAPFHPEDTLFMGVTFAEENVIQPKFSMSMADDRVARELSEGHRRSSAMPIPWNQPPGEHWAYLEDVVELSTDSWAYFPLSDGVTDEIPIGSLSSGPYNPFGFPQHRDWEAYVYVGVIRPGFPVLTSVYEIAPKGFYWNASPNVFGRQFNRGLNGDLPGDVYRMTAGVVLKDLRTGERWYDAYATTISTRNFPEAPGSVSILAPGERPLRAANGRDQYLFLASDTHDLLEVGEVMGLGGIVMPVVEADVEWKITKPSGEVAWMHGSASRIGTVGGSPPLPVDEPGVYRIEPLARWSELEGDIPGLVDGSFWHAAVPKDNPHEGMLSTPLPPVLTVDAVDGVEIPLTWPDDLEGARLWFGVIMPGQVLDQGVIDGSAGAWSYDFEPIQWAAQATNFDARDLGTGQWQLAETVVFQFFIEGERDGEMVYDGLRLFLRRDQLYNYRALTAK